MLGNASLTGHTEYCTYKVNTAHRQILSKTDESVDPRNPPSLGAAMGEDYSPAYHMASKQGIDRAPLRLFD